MAILTRPVGRDEPALVTGAAGVIGQALLTELRDAGYTDVRGITSADADLTRRDACEALFADLRPHLVFHLAARAYGIMGNRMNPAEAYLDNIRINTNVVDAARRAGAIKVVAMGSIAIYPDRVPIPMREDDIWNGPPHHTEAAYAHAKRAMLAQLTAYHDQYGLDYAYCVSTNLYGPHDRFDERWGHAVPALISRFHHAVRTGEQITVWGSGTPVRDYLFSADAARAVRLIAELASGPVNLASGTTHTVRDLVELIRRSSGYVGEVVWDASKPDGQADRGYDISRLQQLGFAPQFDLATGIDLTYRWYAANAERVRR